jgi:putative flippase GtrA
VRIQHRKLWRFLLAGAPTFAGAVLLNYALVHWLGWGKALAYATVLTVQTTANFFVCRIFVFEARPVASLWRSFAVFFNGIILFRLFDWLVYVLLTQYLNVPFIGAQLFNVVLFGLLKFEFARRVFEPGGEAKDPSDSRPE